MTFHDLGICTPILTALKEQGYQTPSPIQAKAIPPALEGRDVLGCAQTGTGKTCAFAVPILQRLSGAGHLDHRLRALILTPTRELAIQIGESFQAYGAFLSLRTAVIFGGVSQGPQVERLKRGVDILVATPGRLGDLYQQGLLSLDQLEIFVLDEADRMLDMGFIHDVKKILKWLPAQKQTLLFSATMPKEITQLVDSLLHHPVRVAVNPVSSTVEAIEQSVYFVDKGNKTKLLALLVRQLNVKNALVFTRTKHGANKVARDLMKEGISAAAIHGNKSQTARQQALAAFKSGEVRCLVATDIAARGLDIEELSHVFNYNLPEVPETYVHRIGRTGRAGRGGAAVAFCDFGEKPLLKAIEALNRRSIPVVEDHPFPMVVLEAPSRDKHGRIINEEDAEARSAAKERHRSRNKAPKEAGHNPSQDSSHSQEAAPKQPVHPKRSAAKASANSQESKRVSTQAAPKPAPRRNKLTPPGTRMDTGNAMPRTDLAHPDPLAGDRIMDATARLLAPRKSTVSHREEPNRTVPRKHRRSKREDARQPAAQPAKAAQPKTAKQPPRTSQRPAHAPRPDRRRDRGPRAPMEAMKSNRTKDSTEQHSLMKPYYLDN